MKWLAGVLQRLVEPAVKTPEARSYQARLLAWLVVASLLSEIAILVRYAIANPLIWMQSPVTAILAATFAAFIAVFALSRTGHYRPAAILTVAIASLGTWSVVIGVPLIGGQDQVALTLTFLTISVLLCSVVLSVKATLTLAVVHVVGIELLRYTWPGINPSSLLTAEIFISFVFVLIIVLALLRQRDQTQLDQQAAERRLTQQALQESRDNLAKAQSIARIGSWTWDFATNKIAWSDEMYQIVGLRPEDFDGQMDTAITKIAHPADQEKLLRLMEHILHGDGPTQPVEYRILRPDGGERVVIAQGDNILDNTGKPLGMVGTMQDITERKQAEQELQRRYEELTTLNLFGQALSHLRESDEILEMVLSTIGRLLDNANLFIALYDESRQLISFPIYTIDGQAREPFSRPSANGLTEYVLRTKQPLLIARDMENALTARGINAVGRMAKCFLSVPMLVGERAVGVIAVQDYQHEEVYGLPHVELLMTVASQTAIALDNARLYAAIRQELAEREKMAEALSEAEVRYRTLVEQLPAITYVVELGPVNRTTYISPQVTSLLGFSPEEWVADPDLWIKQVHPADREWVLAEVRDRDERGEPVALEYRVLARDGRTVWVRNESTLVTDDAGQPRYAHGVMFHITDRKLAEATLQETNEKLAQGLNELEQRNREIALLNEMGDLLQACPNAEDAYKVIANIGRQLFPGEAGAVYVISPSHDIVETVAEWGNSESKEVGEQVFMPDDCWALRRGRLHIAGGTGSSLFCRHLLPAPSGAYACIPMMAQSEALGVLHLQKRFESSPSPALEADAYFTNAKRRLAQTVADSIGLALANLKLRETLRNQSIRDSLTSLFNRRYMEVSLEREISRAARSRLSVGIIMLDLDNFKTFNDTFGHDAGDAVLRELGLFLQRHTRGGDIACRYGGEEFTLILPDASVEATLRRAEHLREELKHLSIEHRDQVLGSVSLSAGVAAYPEHGASAEALLRAADAALYRAKSEGRDRVVTANDP